MAATTEGSDSLDRLSFEILPTPDTNVSGPRLGKLSLKGRRTLETPNFFAVTSRGAVPHITPDVISGSTQIGGVHLALEDFIEKAMLQKPAIDGQDGVPPILNCPGPSPLHTFTALPTPVISLLAPRRTPAVSSPNGNNNTAISVFTSTGFQTLSNKSYITYIQKLRPDIAISLADVAYGTAPGTKRIAKMGDRTQDYLSQLLSSDLENQAIFAPILPIDSLAQSEYLNHLADDLADDIQGLAFYDSDLLPDIPATTAISKLPRVALDEPRSPHQILRFVGLGMDVFTVPFVGFATDAGIALTFRFPRPLASPDAANSPVDDEKKNAPLPLGIDMWSPTNATSLSPLSASCSCYTCTSHHKAYIQHLLSAKEMLGWVLLQIHNHHILSELFTAVRKSIGRGGFEHDCMVFGRTWEAELPEKSGQGPRARGYHFKSEGPGEEKRNKAAWGDLGGEETVNGGEENRLVPEGDAGGLEDMGFAGKVGA